MTEDERAIERLAKRYKGSRQVMTLRIGDVLRDRLI